VRDPQAVIVRTATGSAAAVGVPGVFVPDVPLLTGIWATMLVALAEEAGHEMNKEFAIKVGTGLVTGMGSMVAGVKTFSWFIKWVPGIGTGSAMAINTSLNGFFTYRLGRAWAEMVDRPDFTMTDAVAIVGALLTLMTSR
jgi:uncharacterized protein (DUF697 family)